MNIYFPDSHSSKSSYQVRKQPTAKGQSQYLLIDNNQLSLRLKWKMFHQGRYPLSWAFSFPSVGILNQDSLLSQGAELGDPGQAFRVGEPSVFVITQIHHKQSQGHAPEHKWGGVGFLPMCLVTVSSEYFIFTNFTYFQNYASLILASQTHGKIKETKCQRNSAKANTCKPWNNRRYCGHIWPFELYYGLKQKQLLLLLKECTVIVYL